MTSMRVLGRLLVLIAVLLMPLGMQSAAASPRGAHDHAIMAGSVMEHCPDQLPTRGHDDGLMTCGMACASALPAQELVRVQPILGARQHVAPMLAQTLLGLLPDIPTPPPKRA